MAVVKPDKPQDISSYRPVALVSCVSKVIEFMVLARREWYLGKHSLFPDAMAGFAQDVHQYTLLSTLPLPSGMRNTPVV